MRKCDIPGSSGSRRMRPCLKCKHPFESLSPFHRLCRHCQKLNGKLGGMSRFKTFAARRQRAVLLEA